MAKSLIEELPKIADEGRREAARILERLSSPSRVGLQTNEIVLPAKDEAGLYRGQVGQLDPQQKWMNRLVYGDNLLTLQALLAGDPATGLLYNGILYKSTFSGGEGQSGGLFHSFLIIIA